MVFSSHPYPPSCRYLKTLSAVCVVTDQEVSVIWLLLNRLNRWDHVLCGWLFGHVTERMIEWTITTWMMRCSRNKSKRREICTTQTNHLTNEWMDEWMNEWKRKSYSEWMNKRVRKKNERKKSWMNRRMDGWMDGRTEGRMRRLFNQLDMMYIVSLTCHDLCLSD